MFDDKYTYGCRMLKYYIDALTMHMWKGKIIMFNIAKIWEKIIMFDTFR